MTMNPQIAPALARALEKKGFTTLTEVQDAVLAPDAAGADLLVSAQTGSGKTVAFGMAIAPTLLGDDDAFTKAGAPLALVVAPTRELALQVERELTWLYADARGKIASCVGGMDARSERRALERGSHIVVGTPGRLRDHIERGALDMSALRAVVLDEADEMLDFGFREDLEFILDTAPAERRTLMFSATVPPAIAKLATQYQKNAVRLSTVSERQQHVDIEYVAMAVAPSDRENAIINILRYHDAESALVFCATREGVNRLASRLGNRGFSAVALSGELSQNERTHALQAMRDGRARVCIATDVASRGIDLPGLELVVHADLPVNGEVLLHRSGRTGRAGRKGKCLLIVPHTRRSHANRLLRAAKVKAEWAAPPSLEDVQAMDRERLLSDPSLTASYDDDAMIAARELLERHGPEQVAAAFLVRGMKDLPSAEELLDAPGPAGGSDRGDAGGQRDFKKKQRAPFVGGVWFRATAGRKHRAEPRWLLPLICRLGHVTKKDVGAIEIGEKESRFEISAAAAERFAAALEASGGGEKSIRILRDDGTGEAITPAAGPARAPRKPRPEGKGHAKPRRERPSDAADAPAPKSATPKPTPAKPAPKKAASSKPAPVVDDMPAAEDIQAKPWKKKPAGKAPHKKADGEKRKKKPRWTAADKKAKKAAAKLEGDKPLKRAKKKKRTKSS